jgi:hypothetical protein
MSLGTTHTGLKHPSRWVKTLVLSALAVAAGAAVAQSGAPYAQTNLVSNVPGLATITDLLRCG